MQWKYNFQKFQIQNLWLPEDFLTMPWFIVSGILWNFVEKIPNFTLHYLLQVFFLMLQYFRSFVLIWQKVAGRVFMWLKKAIHLIQTSDRNFMQYVNFFVVRMRLFLYIYLLSVLKYNMVIIILSLVSHRFLSWSQRHTFK